MKLLTFNFRNALPALLCCVVLATTAGAQEAASSWVKVAPPDEAFTVMMPQTPSPVAERSKSGAFQVAGQRYSLRHNNAEYTVWSFKAASLPAALSRNIETYLDRCAEIAWNLMIEPEWKRLEGKSPDEMGKYHLDYEGDLISGGHPGRSYLLYLGERQGTTHIYAVGSQIYIIAAAAGAATGFAGVKQFLKSFTLNLPVREVVLRLTAGSPVRFTQGTGESMGVGPGTGSGVESSTGGGVGQNVGGGTGPGTGVGIGSGTGGGVGPGRGERGGTPIDPGPSGGGGKAEQPDYTRTFMAREVTRKAQILAKPEPSYTEWARKFYVIGTVRMRIVLRGTGEVGDITPITKLPHGLLENAIGAARKISFKPAEKDGRKVSQYVTFEYNFNIY